MVPTSWELWFDCTTLTWGGCTVFDTETVQMLFGCLIPIVCVVTTEEILPEADWGITCDSLVCWSDCWDGCPCKTECWLFSKDCLNAGRLF